MKKFSSLNSGPDVEAALSWVEANSGEASACSEVAAKLEQLPEVQAYWPNGAAPSSVLNTAASFILAAEVRRLRKFISAA